MPIRNKFVIATYASFREYWKLSHALNADANFSVGSSAVDLKPLINPIDGGIYGFECSATSPHNITSIRALWKNATSETAINATHLINASIRYIYYRLFKKNEEYSNKIQRNGAHPCEAGACEK